MTLWHRLALEVPIGLVCFGVVGTLLWRLRSWRYWAVALGFGIMIAAITVYTFLAHDGGDSPIASGLAVGCGMPTIYMFLYQLNEEKKRG